MASTDSSTSSTIAEDHKRTVDDAFLHKMKSLVERLRLENATLKKSLDAERSGIRSLKAQHETAVRNLKTEYKKKEEFLEKQLRTSSNNRSEEPVNNNNKLAELKKLTLEIQFLKSANKGLQERLKVAIAAECARASELRALAAKHEASELVARRQSRAQCQQLLEEIKSKERVIAQLRREAARGSHNDQAQRMEEPSRKVRADPTKEKTNREDLKTDIQHRKETFYRLTNICPQENQGEMSSASVSPAPSSLSDMWACGQCRAAEVRASASARECARLADALRDARDQLELMEFRLLELEDANPDKGARDNLTDSDSGCVSPGSRIKDSASPELKRTDSGYKSPPHHSPHNHRKLLPSSHDELREEFAKTQILADILDRNSESSDSLRNNPVKEHLEHMILNAGSAEDRNCLEQVLMLLYNLQTLSSSVSEDEYYQAKPTRNYDQKQPRSELDILSLKPHKAVATVTPYQQKRYKAESLDSLCDEKKPTNILQESGIFEETETECKSTQTDNENFDGELNTEIQRLNSIRERLEKQGVRSRTLNSKEDTEGLECGCVRLGKKHKQYYERRLKFLEGKISIYEAAQDVKESKLAQRLQKEYLLENRIQELESQLSELQDKYERLEEECCELEEIENDTRLHWQQLEMDYELCSAQLRDMTEQRECSRAQAERMSAELSKRECELKKQEQELLTRLRKLEKAVPALIAWNVMQAVGATITPGGQRTLLNRIGPYGPDTRALIAQVREESQKMNHCRAMVAVTDNCCIASTPTIEELEKQIRKLLSEKNQIESEASQTIEALKRKVEMLEGELETAQRQLSATVSGVETKKERIESKILELEKRSRVEKERGNEPADNLMLEKLQLLKSNEKSLKSKIAELEKREKAYLEMLTQADDMWAEMEGGYKKKIQESQNTENKLKSQVKKLETEKKTCLDNMKMKLREVQESESGLKIALEKAQRDAKIMKEKTETLTEMYSNADAQTRKSEEAIKTLEAKFKKEVDQLRKLNKCLGDDLQTHKQVSKKSEVCFLGDLDNIRKELNRTTKMNQELEVTNSELKEEVESLEKQLTLTQKALSQCKRKCDEKIKTLSHELSIKTEELEELRSETMRQSLQASRIDLKPDRTEYVDEGYNVYTAVPKKIDYGRMHHSMSYITSDSRCSCPTLRSQLVGQLIEDLFDRVHNSVDDELSMLCKEIAPVNAREVNAETKAKITNYLLMAISKELVRSIGDADAKTDSEEWRRTVSSMPYAVNKISSNPARDEWSSALEGNAGVVSGAARLASLTCACAATTLCTAAPHLADTVKSCQEEVLEHGDVKIMEEQLANAIESIVNCPSCALGTNTIVWSTDV